MTNTGIGVGSRSQENDYSFFLSPLSTFGVHTEEFRTVGPIYLPLPVQDDDSAISRVLLDNWVNRGLKEFVDRALEQFGITPENPPIITQRMTKYDPGCGVLCADTIFVYTRKTLGTGTSWIRVSDEILECCKRRGLSVNVEIVEVRGLIRRVSLPIDPRHPLVYDWDAMLPHILRTLLPKVDWLNISFLTRTCERIMRELSSDEDLPTPTIVILIKGASTEDWDSCKKSIAKLVEPIYGDVEIEIVRQVSSKPAPAGNIAPEVDPEVKHPGKQLWQEKARVGASVGPAEVKQGLKKSMGGTFGGFVELEYPQSKVVVTVGLTSFQVVAPGALVSNQQVTTYMKQIIRGGLLPGDAKASEIALINMPSNGDHIALHAYHQKRRNAITRPGGPYNQALAQFDRFDEEGLCEEDVVRENLMDVRDLNNFTIDQIAVQQHSELMNLAERRQQQNQLRFGKVYAASGDRLSLSGSILDWALIDVLHDRVPLENDLPTSIGDTVLSNPVMATFAEEYPIPYQPVMMIGRKSNRTRGWVNAVRYAELKGTYLDERGRVAYQIGRAWQVVDHELTAYKPDTEWQCDDAPHFSQQGDAGAAIFDVHGIFLGLLIGCCEPVDFSYFLSAVELFQDIKQVTGAASVQMIGE